MQPVLGKPAGPSVQSSSSSSVVVLVGSSSGRNQVVVRFCCPVHQQGPRLGMPRIRLASSPQTRSQAHFSSRHIGTTAHASRATIPTIAVVRERARTAAAVVQSSVPIRYGAVMSAGPSVQSSSSLVVHLELASWRLERDGVVRAVALESPQADTDYN